MEWDGHWTIGIINFGEKEAFTIDPLAGLTEDLPSTYLEPDSGIEVSFF